MIWTFEFLHIKTQIRLKSSEKRLPALHIVNREACIILQPGYISNPLLKYLDFSLTFTKDSAMATSGYPSRFRRK